MIASAAPFAIPRLQPTHLPTSVLTSLPNSTCVQQMSRTNEAAGLHCREIFTSFVIVLPWQSARSIATLLLETLLTGEPTASASLERSIRRISALSESSRTPSQIPTLDSLSFVGR